MKTKLLAVMLLAGGSLFAETHFSIGIGIGTLGYYAPPPPPVAACAPPPCPGPGYTSDRGILVSCRTALLLARGLLGPPAVSERLLDRPSLLRTPLLSRLLGAP